MKTPTLSALSATLYIALISSGLWYLPRYEHETEGPIVPAMVLSLLVLSVVVMAIIFFRTPALLYADGKAREAVSFLVKTASLFAALTFVVVLCFLYVGSVIS